jgi:peptide/nickel transport system permease protein
MNEPAAPARLAAPRPRRLPRVFAHPSLAIGAVLVALLVATALLSLLWLPYAPAEIDIANRLAAPSAAHWLGTDALGRDIASQLMAGAQASLAAGVIAVGIGLAGGVALGLLAAARGGWLDAALMRAADFTFAFPALLTALMLSAILGPGLVVAIVAIGVFNVPVFARLARASARAVWSREFVLAARACGKGPLAITREHVLPNIAGVLIVQATLQFATAILAEAALAYLGLGTQPPTPSWGRLLGDAQQQLFQAPWLAVWPGAAIALAVLGLNLLGDGLRDVLDPRLAHERR